MLPAATQAPIAAEVSVNEEETRIRWITHQADPPLWVQVTDLNGVIKAVICVGLLVERSGFRVQGSTSAQITDGFSVFFQALSDESLSQAILTSPVAFSLGIGDVLENPSTAIFSIETLPKLRASVGCHQTLSDPLSCHVS